MTYWMSSTGAASSAAKVAALPETVSAGCTILISLMFFMARMRSPSLRTYAHEKVVDAPGSMVSNLKTMLMPSSAERGLDSEYDL